MLPPRSTTTALWSPPATTNRMGQPGGSPSTSRGVGWQGLAGAPHWPLSLLPNARTQLPLSSASVCRPPAETWRMRRPASAATCRRKQGPVWQPVSRVWGACLPVLEGHRPGGLNDGYNGYGEHGCRLEAPHTPPIFCLLPAPHPPCLPGVVHVLCVAVARLAPRPSACAAGSIGASKRSLHPARTIGHPSACSSAGPCTPPAPRTELRTPQQPHSHTCSCAHLPNVQTPPSAASSTVWSSPQLSWRPVTPPSARTTCGALRFSMSPCPSAPYRPRPQVSTRPSASSAAECASPQATCTTPSGQSRLMGRGTSVPARHAGAQDYGGHECRYPEQAACSRSWCPGLLHVPGSPRVPGKGCQRRVDRTAAAHRRRRPAHPGWCRAPAPQSCHCRS